MREFASDSLVTQLDALVAIEHLSHYLSQGLSLSLNEQHGWLMFGRKLAETSGNADESFVQINVDLKHWFSGLSQPLLVLEASEMFCSLFEKVWNLDLLSMTLKKFDPDVYDWSMQRYQLIARLPGSIPYRDQSWLDLRNNIAFSVLQCIIDETPFDAGRAWRSSA
jgi:hypothetical protein